MIQRCTNPKNAKYGIYGASGITIDERWFDFATFLADMGERPKGTTIDRLDGSSGYSKDNCRWANIVEQQNNLKSNRVVIYEGRRITASQLARQLGVDKNTLYYRIRAGWPPEEWGRSAWGGNRHSQVNAPV